jgi:hypothetical protein
MNKKQGITSTLHLITVGPDLSYGTYDFCSIEETRWQDEGDKYETRHHFFMLSLDAFQQH